MKVLSLLLTGWLAASAHAAVSDILFPFGGSSFTGSASSIAFDGQSFVTTTVQSNGAIGLTMLDTNGVPRTNLSLGVFGTAPRIAIDAANVGLAWVETNGSARALLCGRIENGALVSTSTVATAIAPDSLCLRVTSGKFLAIWQSTGAKTSVIARWLDPQGAPIGDAFPISPSVSAQCYPSVNLNGSPCLVTWMEQNTSSNDWRVVARLVGESGPLGSSMDVSTKPTALFRFQPLACSAVISWSPGAGPKVPSRRITSRSSIPVGCR